MKIIDGYLSSRASGCWPTAVVEVEAGQWRLIRHGVPPVGLGESFAEARSALFALMRATRRSQHERERYESQVEAAPTPAEIAEAEQLDDNEPMQ